jgi:hypothetical protein
MLSFGFGQLFLDVGFVLLQLSDPVGGCLHLGIVQRHPTSNMFRDSSVENPTLLSVEAFPIPHHAFA